MKQLLIIDAPSIFCDFIKEKLSNENVSIETADSRRDGFTKMLSLLPDLIIIDDSASLLNVINFLKKKFQNPNAVSIPLIITGGVLNPQYAPLLTHFNVRKYFNKPINFDSLFEYIESELGVACAFDSSEAIFDIHSKNDIVCIDIAKGLNRDKIALLKYQLRSIGKKNSAVPFKILIILTNIHLSYVDGVNLEYLFNTLLQVPLVQKKYIKVLTFDPYVRTFLARHPDYQGIETAENIKDVLNNIIQIEPTSDISALIAEKILGADMAAAPVPEDTSPVSEAVPEQTNTISSSPYTIAIADAAFGEALRAAFITAGLNAVAYKSGTIFLNEIAASEYDLIIVGFCEPDYTCFDLLVRMQAQDITIPTFVYASNLSIESVKRATTLGAKKCLAAPMKPEIVVEKTIDYLTNQLSIE